MNRIESNRIADAFNRTVKLYQAAARMTEARQSPQTIDIGIGLSHPEAGATSVGVSEAGTDKIVSYICKKNIDKEGARDDLSLSSTHASSSASSAVAPPLPPSNYRTGISSAGGTKGESIQRSQTC
jgi:hypothetical protein